MENLTRWDVALLILAAYLAVTLLVRLMLGYQQQLETRFKREVEVDRRLREEKELEEAKKARKTA